MLTREERRNEYWREEGRTEKRHNPLCVRSKSLGTKNDLSYWCSSDRRIDTGSIWKEEKKKENTKKAQKNV